MATTTMAHRLPSRCATAPSSDSLARNTLQKIPHTMSKKGDDARSMIPSGFHVVAPSTNRSRPPPPPPPPTQLAANQQFHTSYTQLPPSYPIQSLSHTQYAPYQTRQPQYPYGGAGYASPYPTTTTTNPGSLPPYQTGPSVAKGNHTGALVGPNQHIYAHQFSSSTQDVARQDTNGLASRKRPRDNNLASHQQQPPPPPPLKEGPSYECSPCGLSFETIKALNEHTKTHTTCTKCSFVGSPKAVKGHFQAAHGKFAGSGWKHVTVAVPGCPVQRFKICVGNRPEDIQQWIAERKRRFPRTHESKTDKQTSHNTNEGASAGETKGISSLLQGYGSSSDEDESNDTGANEMKPKETTNETIQSATATNDHSSNNTNSKLRTRPCRYFARFGTCRYGENCTFLHENVSTTGGKGMDGSDKPESNNFRRKQCRFFLRHGTCRNGDACTFSHEVAFVPPREDTSLLGKLLRNDQKRERTLTLQLLEHIVNTSFLKKT